MNVLGAIKNISNIETLRKVGKEIWARRRIIGKIIGYSAGGAAVVIAVKKSAEIVHTIEDAAEAKGEQLTFVEKGSLIFKQMPEVFMLSALSVGAMLASDISGAKEIVRVNKENKTLTEQVVGIANAYNAVNDISAGVKKHMIEKNPELEQQFKEAEKAIIQSSEKTIEPKNGCKTVIENSDPKKKRSYAELYGQTGDERYRLVLYKERLTGRCFMACRQQLDDAITEARKMLTENGKGFVSLNDIYDLIGIGPSVIGEYYIFRYNQDYISFSTFAEESENGMIAYMVLCWDNAPFCDKASEYKGF